MAGEETTSNIRLEQAIGRMGLDMDSSLNQIEQGKLSYALNAALENFDANTVNYQNDASNELCLNFPKDYHVIGEHFINEQNKHVFFLVNPTTGASEIGYMENNDCTYHTYVSGACLNFNIDNPIHKAVHKITNCATEIYWTDGLNNRRYLNLTDPNSWKKIVPGTVVCDNRYLDELDCNKLNIQPDFTIPQLAVKEIINVGSLTAGTYQFAIQYSNGSGDGYTSYYSVTNPTPIFDAKIVTPDFNYPVGKAIVLNISNIDVTGYFQYFNLAVIKTVNSITSVELVGTYFIDTFTREITYTGQNQTQIKLTVNDIFEKFPYYEIAQDLTAVQDVLVWDNLTSIDTVNYQGIANQITLNWETYKLPANEDYADGFNATNLRGYLRDEVYAFEIVFLLTNGKQTDGFHIPGRVKGPIELSTPDVPNTNDDFIGTGTSAPYWKIYNTATVTGNATGDPIGNATPYQYGEFAYWESEEVYPCNELVWGSLANTPIRHHKFPDILVSPAFESGEPTISLDGTYTQLIMENEAIYPIGVKLDIAQIQNLIRLSSLSQEQKDAITGFKIVRGNRSTNSSIVAKGILRNVGKYEREGTEYYFPNYPYNDFQNDPFLLKESNAFNSECNTYTVVSAGADIIDYTNCTNGEVATRNIIAGETIRICSLTLPIARATTPTITIVSFDTYRLTSRNEPGIFGENVTIFKITSPETGEVIYFNVSQKSGINEPNYKSSPATVVSSTYPTYYDGSLDYTIEQISSNSNPECYPQQFNGFSGYTSHFRYVFNSPDTSFGQPFLGSVLKLENVLYGAGSAHFVEVKKNALYKLITKEAQYDALVSSQSIAEVTGTLNPTAMFTAYQAYLQIYINGITRKNYAYSYNSIAKYNYSNTIANNLGIKQRTLDLYQYLIPGVQNVGDDRNVNNFNRESSVYLRTNKDKSYLPICSQTPSLLLPTGDPKVEDLSRYTISSVGNCTTPNKEFPITVVSYYGSIKNIFPNQWGQMYSYDTIDTGFQVDFDYSSTQVVFGGDTFINKFSFKTKLPFFIDNRVNAPDDSDVFYDEIGNVAYPEYWHSARSVLLNYTYDEGGTNEVILKNIISYKANHLDCPNNQLLTANNPGRTFYDGKMYMFAYGVPTFYCESNVNVDLRQAFNNREGDFYPHVSSGIPDNWLQESFVPIIQDNTYYYNVTFSKQNKENYFSHLPVDWDDDQCYTNFPFRAIYSDPQQSYTDNAVNSWLIYRPISFFDFPQNYGKLTSLDGIQNRAILARFDNKSLLYNTMLTINTSNPQAAYLGNDSLFKSAPPIDFAETDLGYVGSQNKMLLKIPQGQISIDAKRGQVFLIAGNQAKELSGFGSGVNRFFTDHLAFEILRYFPTVDTDNHFNGCGLHGVYDSKYERFFISKLDYVPLSKDIKYNSSTKEFYIERTIGTNTIVRTEVYLTDADYFCNKSWTLSFNFNTMRWVSFHSFIPNFYIAENNFFYSGINTGWDIDIIASQEVTTTTSTTTTVAPLNCNLVGTASIVNCGFDGNAVILYPATINWNNDEFASPYIDSDLVINGVTYAGTDASGTFTLAPNTVTTVQQKSDQNAVGTSANWTLVITNVTDGVTVYSNLVTGLAVFGPGAYQIIQQTTFTALPGKTYSIVANSY
jgi:hypothetical protein